MKLFLQIAGRSWQIYGTTYTTSAAENISRDSWTFFENQRIFCVLILPDRIILSA